MLLGLLQDVEGNRFRPSHTVKNGKRYRYYFCQATTENSNSQSKAIRLPAYDLERQVLLRLQSFLRSPNEVLKSFTIPGDHPELTQQLITAAKNQAAQLSTTSDASVRVFVRKVVRRVVVQTDRMEVETSRSEFRDSFTNNQLGASTGTALQQPEERSDDLIRLAVETRLKRCGGEMRLVVSPESSRPEIVTPILKAVIRAHKWREEVLRGNAANRTLAARRLEFKNDYLRRVLGCAFLAPDIVKAILDSGQPAGLTLKKICSRRLPLDWAEQRAQLGFPPRQLEAVR